GRARGLILLKDDRGILLVLVPPAEFNVRLLGARMHVVLGQAMEAPFRRPQGPQRVELAHFGSVFGDGFHKPIRHLVREARICCDVAAVESGYERFFLLWQCPFGNLMDQNPVPHFSLTLSMAALS